LRVFGAPPIMVTMDWRVCLGATLITACFIKPGPPGVAGDATRDDGGHGDAGGGDSGIGDAASTGCSNVPLHLDFVGMNLNNCGSWAITAGLVSAGNNNPLQMILQPPTGSSCTSRTTSTGAFIRIATFPTGPGDSVFLTAMLPASQVTVRVIPSTATIELMGPGGNFSAGWGGTQTEWLRLMASGPGSIVGEYSIDGTNWGTLGTVTIGGTLAETLHMQFGVAPGSSGGGSGAVYEYNECR
jgi:hypothetical protein